MGLSTLRDASASSLTATAPTELASRAASLSRRSTTSSGTLRKYKVRMLQYASSLLAQCLGRFPSDAELTAGCRLPSDLRHARRGSAGNDSKRSALA